MECYASCPGGFERALADELRHLDVERIRPLKGRVSFEADGSRDIYRVCLWSRLASRVLAVIGRVPAADAGELYEQVRSLPWETVLADGATIAVSARGTSPALRNTKFTALRVKDAICDRMAEQTGARPNVDAEHAAASIAVSLRGDRATLAFDMSGEPLFKRLPREATRPGPAHVLRPDYAALALREAGWDTRCREEGAVLVDLSCAGGGIVLEAADMAADRAPGLLRRRWGFEGWKGFDRDVWTAVLDEAGARASAAAKRDARTAPRIIATDVDREARTFAEQLLHTTAMGIDVAFRNPDETLEAAMTSAVASQREHGPHGAAGGKAARCDRPRAACLVADVTGVPIVQLPPVVGLAAQLADRLPEAPFACLARTDVLARALGGATGAIDVRPNNEPATIYRVDRDEAPAAPEATSATQAELEGASSEQAAHDAARPKVDMLDLGEKGRVPILVSGSEQFAARLRKVTRLRRKWAKREDVSCYRVYDADLPDYAVAIDLYTGSASTPGRWLVIAEYQAPKTVDPELAQARFLDVLSIAPYVLDVEPSHVFAKSRIRAKGGSQYAQRPHAKAKPSDAQAKTERAPVLVEEGGLTFEVNFDDRLDTGLFLDHRITRGLVRREAERLAEKGLRRFLNLFAYTGTATCYAADGGATDTTTVDLSNTYLDWADRNLYRNGFPGDEHALIRADVLDWIDRERHGRNRWDLIFCDPPTFSNSSGMRSSSFEVQRDHVELLIGVSRLLTREGEAIFSCNLRTFKPDCERLARAGVVLRDITAETIPEDFARNPRIHRCYIVTRTTPEEAQRQLDRSR